jgi:hypothetical protein
LKDLENKFKNIKNIKYSHKIFNDREEWIIEAFKRGSEDINEIWLTLKKYWEKS